MNVFVVVPPIKIETVYSVMILLQIEKWVAKYDLKDAFKIFMYLWVVFVLVEALHFVCATDARVLFCDISPMLYRRLSRT